MGRASRFAAVRARESLGVNSGVVTILRSTARFCSNIPLGRTVTGGSVRGS
jgi:hypothetical protein